MFQAFSTLLDFFFLPLLFYLHDWKYRNKISLWYINIDVLFLTLFQNFQGFRFMVFFCLSEYNLPFHSAHCRFMQCASVAGVHSFLLGFFHKRAATKSKGGWSSWTKYPGRVLTCSHCHFSGRRAAKAQQKLIFRCFCCEFEPLFEFRSVHVWSGLKRLSKRRQKLRFNI